MCLRDCLCARLASRKFYQPNTMAIGATSAHMKLAQILLEVAPHSDKEEYSAFLQRSRGLYNSFYQNQNYTFVYVDGVEQTVT